MVTWRSLSAMIKPRLYLVGVATHVKQHGRWREGKMYQSARRRGAKESRERRIDT